MYKIKGFISTVFSEKASYFLLTPDPAYLSPCRKYAEGYSEGFELESKCFELKDNKLPLTIDDNPSWLPYLVNIALAQRPVLLRIDECGKRIVGYTYPAD